MILRASEQPVHNNETRAADVIVVGAGVAGLVCAIELTRAGQSVIVSSAIGGLWRASELMHSSSIEGAACGGKMAAMALLGARAGNKP